MLRTGKEDVLYSESLNPDRFLVYNLLCICSPSKLVQNDIETIPS